MSAAVLQHWRPTVGHVLGWFETVSLECAKNALAALGANPVHLDEWQPEFVMAAFYKSSNKNSFVDLG
jgi:hypothetical protein